MVPLASLAFMAVSLLICLALPVGGMAVLVTRRDAVGARRWPRLARAFWCGALAFTASQLLTRLPLMTLVVPQLPPPVSGWLLSTPVASFSAGLFEETGRLVVMLLLLRGFHRWADGAAFGLGHDGIEAVLLSGSTMLNSIIVAVMINTGHWEALAGRLPAAAAEHTRAGLVDTPAWMFLLTGLERIPAVTLHLAGSLIVLAGIVHGRRLVAWLTAVLLHGSFNLVATQLLAAGVATVLIEAVLLAIAAVLWVAILRGRRHFPQTTVPVDARPSQPSFTAPAP